MHTRNRVPSVLLSARVRRVGRLPTAPPARLRPGAAHAGPSTSRQGRLVAPSPPAHRAGRGSGLAGLSSSCPRSLTGSCSRATRVALTGTTRSCRTRAPQWPGQARDGLWTCTGGVALSVGSLQRRPTRKAPPACTRAERWAAAGLRLTCGLVLGLALMLAGRRAMPAAAPAPPVAPQPGRDPLSAPGRHQIRAGGAAACSGGAQVHTAGGGAGAGGEGGRRGGGRSGVS